MTNSLSRRGFLQGATLAGAALVSPLIAFRADAKAAAGELLMVPAAPNPNGAADALYLLKGDPLAGAVKTIVTETGNPVPTATLADGERKVLRLMHFNDMHNHITDMHKKKGDTHRLSQMVKIVNDRRAAAADNETVLFLSAGDDHTGSVFDELMGWSVDEFEADAGYRTYSAAGVDIATLGNHEFDRGAALLQHAIKADAQFPVLSANVGGSDHLKRDDDYTCAAVIEAKGLRIGVIGLTTDVDTRVGLDSDPDMFVASPVQAVKNVLPTVAGVSDVVVVLSHCGYGTGAHASGKSSVERRIGEGDFDIAGAVSGLTDKPIVLIGGHSHTALNSDGIDADNMVGDLLITQAKANGSHLGEIVMSIAAGQGRDQWFSNVSLNPIKKRDDRVSEGEERYANLEHDGDFDAVFEAAHVQPLIDKLEVKLQEVIGTVSDDSLINTEATIAARYVSETAIANFCNDAMVARSATFPQGKVDFALFNATAISAGLSKGDVTFKNVFEVMPYADACHVAYMTGRQIQEMLHNNAKRVLRPEEQTDDVNLAGFVQRGFLHFSSGLRYRIELGASAVEARAVDVTLNGTPIEQLLDQTFAMAINSYIQLGAFGEAWNGKPISGGVPGDIASMDLRGLNYLHTGLIYRNELIAAIREMGAISADTGAALDGRLQVG